MSRLAIKHWTGEKREVQFVGYNRDHTVCFIRDEQNARRAITLLLPNAFDIHFRKSPIGKNGSPPVEITRTALHLPACFASKKEMEAFCNPDSDEAQCACAGQHDLWKAVTRHKCWLEPKDDVALQRLLDEELARHQKRYAIRAKEIADQIAALPAEDTKVREQLNMELRASFSVFAEEEQGKTILTSIFDVPLEEVRKGWAGLRERLLEQDWAEHFRVDLQAMRAEAAAFHNWLEKCAFNARERITDLQTKAVEFGLALSLDPWQWEILQAAVLYEIRFADGSRCWLIDIEERAITDPQEVQDFESLEAAGKVLGDEKLMLDDVCRELSVKWKQRRKPISPKGLKKLCKRTGVSFKFPMPRNDLEKLQGQRKRQDRSRIERLKSYHRRRNI